MTTKTKATMQTETRFDTIESVELDNVTGGCAKCGAAGCGGTQPQGQQLGGLWNLGAALRR